ncbi:EamA family transporter [Candidatus Daviesbacteria bacterium]|nr:EamA family transporter [Candidatus Daviesbacteria bacterium]
MTWLYLALLSVLGTTLSNIFRKVALKNDQTDPYLSAIIFQFLGALMVGVIAFSRGFVLPPITKYPVNFLLNGILWGIATSLLFKTYQYLDASEATIITTLETVIAILSATLLLREHFSLVNIIGTIIIISAVIFVSYKKGLFKFNQGYLYAFGYSLFAGFGITNDAFLTRNSEPLSYLTIAFALPGIVILIGSFKKIKIAKAIYNFTWAKNMLLLTFFYVFAAIAWFLSISSGGQASQITPINQSSIILTIILAVIFLKERENLPKKVISATLVTIGVLLLK